MPLLPCTTTTTTTGGSKQNNPQIYPQQTAKGNRPTAFPVPPNASQGLFRSNLSVPFCRFFASIAMIWLSDLYHRFLSHFVAPAVSTASSSIVLHRRQLLKQSPSPPDKQQLNLLSLPDDILLEIVRLATHCRHDNASHPALHVVEHRSCKSAVSLAYVSHKVAELFYASLDNVSLASSPVSDRVIEPLARRAGPALKRLVLRGSISITNASLRVLARHSTSLCSLDLSFIPRIDHQGLTALCQAAGPRLRHLLLRKCTGIDDDTLTAISACSVLHTLDISYCPRVTDSGMKVLLTSSGSTMRLLAIAHNAALTDLTFSAVASNCYNLVQFCARGLPLITDTGFLSLCSGVGRTIEGVDVTLCHYLTRDATLRTLSSHCHSICLHVMPKFTSRTLRQIIISTLRQNIFIVHGSDPDTGKDTVHTVLIDNGDVVSASLLNSGTTDLSMLGIVLCKSYGSALSEDTKQMLEDDYGIPMSSLTD